MDRQGQGGGSVPCQATLRQALTLRSCHGRQQQHQFCCLLVLMQGQVALVALVRSVSCPST